MDGKERLKGAWERAFQPFDRRPIWEWAQEHVRIPSAGSRPGPFDPAIVPHLRRIFEVLRDHETREIGFLAPVRSGKSLVGDVWMPYCLANDPGPFLWTMQKDDVLTKHFESRVLPIIQAARPAAIQLDEASRRTDVKRLEFLNGMELYLGGSSIRNFQNKGTRFGILDEIWEYSEMIQEALARFHEFEEMGVSKAFFPSQGGVSGDGWDLFTSAGQWWEWHVPCQSCGKMFPPVFTGRRADRSYYGLEWPDGQEYRTPHGDWQIEKTIPHVGLSCRECGHVHKQTQALRWTWLNQGDYLMTRDGDPRRKIFHYEATIVRSWDRILADYLDASNARRRGNDDLARIFHQKQRALHYDPGKRMVREIISPKVEVEGHDRTKSVTQLTADRQAEGVHYVVVREWLNDGTGKSIRLWTGRCFSEAEIDEVSKRFPWVRGEGESKKENPAIVMIDCSYEHAEVYRMCARHPRWFALQGEEYRDFTHYEKRNGKKVAIKRSYSEMQTVDPEMGRVGAKRGPKAYKVRWSNPTIKDRLEGLIRQGLMGMASKPEWDDETEEDYQTQMAGQWKAKQQNSNGSVKFVWKDNGNDHYRDCENMQVVGATTLGMLPDLETATEKEESEKEPG